MRFPVRGRGGGPAAVSRYLLPNEQQVITVRRHPAVLIPVIAEALIGLLVAFVLTTTVLHGDKGMAYIVWLAWLVLFIRLLWKALNWAVDFFVVTSQRMMLTTGVFTRKVSMMPLTRVTDMRFQRSFPGRMFGYGEFIVESAGQDQALSRVDHIPYPEQLYLEVCEMLFPITVVSCPLCRRKKTIFVLMVGQVDEYDQPGAYPLPEEYRGTGDDRLPRTYRLADVSGQTREELLTLGYQEVICPQCDGKGTVPAESAARVGDGT